MNKAHPPSPGEFRSPQAAAKSPGRSCALFIQLKPSYHIVTPARVIFLSRSYADGRSRLRGRTAHDFEIKKERACRKLICIGSEKKIS